MLRVAKSDRDGVESPGRVVMIASAVESTLWTEGQALLRRCGSEVLHVQPWGANSARVRVYLDRPREDFGALLEPAAT
jgi:hypothetical protein